MPAVRIPVLVTQTQKPDIVMLHALLYIPSQPDVVMLHELLYDDITTTPLRVLVPTVIPIGESILRPRFPCVESCMGSDAVTHDCVVKVKDRQGLTHHFLIFSQFSEEMPVNDALEAVRPGTIWRGPLIVMLQGRNVFVTSMGGIQTQRLAGLAVAKFLGAHIEMASSTDGEYIPTTVPDN
ncbi:hypothetical protein BV25DRAFT_1921585 [Artomyces pyxidatus]|uniref:Uncharacterized protein n=1 Tax=Artomyces pyxidatus TaxID=48021 RepID=A0ACB8SI45_9AGAM|nr:hypothetical protein BV25DRAFT_1921585 [Artomyces pyxidatus]